MTVSLEYNTERGKLLISEYGRIIQKMVQVAVEEPVRERRQIIANEIIKLMGQLNPHLRDVVDYKHKLWDHLFVMSDFKLDVDSPYPIPTAETIKAKPDPLTYPQSRIKFRFYGKIVPKMIEKISEFEEGPTRTSYINAIGSFMKMSSKAWNLEMLNDDEVMAHLESLSQGKISISESDDLQFKNMQQRKVTAIGEDKYSNGGNHRNNQNRNKFNKNRNFKNFKKRP
ncbi:MAG: methionyl-tRNA formyltransferase [Bacteroidetes bacterium B1(2017)]|nr:MAG: methionyl-tRNA formyltransferase [Bacteroidetes bacterium B1(2017)]